MKKPIRIGLASARIPRILVAIIILAGLAFNTGGQTVTTLWNFSGSGTNGISPAAPLTQGSDGNFYGTTGNGGSFNFGTVFQISPTGNITNLHSFNNGIQHGGTEPHVGLIQGSDGNFYGTTSGGGANACFCGIVFRISPSGSFTNLYSFSAAPNDGSGPQGALAQGGDGNFYGTTSLGGTSTNCSGGCGTIFRISPSGSYTNLYSFLGYPNDAAKPQAGLLQGNDGNFYGTTSAGGTQNSGTVFRISPSGIFTNLYSFGNYPNDGTAPQAGLVQGSDGNFYGTTSQGGMSTNCSGGCGTVFRISPSGSYTNLYSFVGSPSDGRQPVAGLVQGSDGNFYGTTRQGGTDNDGTVFEIGPGGSYTNLYSFVENEQWPVAGLLQGIDGNFYGTTLQGGTYNHGIVFKMTIPLNPPANQISAVQIKGYDLAVGIPSVASETYQLQFTTDLTSGNWSNIPGASITNSIGALLTVTNFGVSVGPQGFYRFDITP